MGTYDSPEVFKDRNDIGGLVKGIEGGIANFQKTVAAKRKKEADAAAKAARKQDKRDRQQDKIYINFHKIGSYPGDPTIPTTRAGKYNRAVEGVLDTLDKTPDDKYQEAENQAFVMASVAKGGMLHLKKYGEIATNMYGNPHKDANGVIVYDKLPNSQSGASLLTNDPHYVAMAIDYHNGGNHGDFYTEGEKTIGWKFQYLEDKDGNIVSWDDLDNQGYTNTDEVNAYLTKNNLKIGESKLPFNELTEKTAGGNFVINTVNRDTYDTFVKGQWDKLGKNIYQQSGGAANAGEKTKTQRWDAAGNVTEIETISYEKTNQAIRDRYLSEIWNIGIDQNAWQAQGHAGIFDNSFEQRLEFLEGTNTVKGLIDRTIDQYAKFDRVTTMTGKEKNTQAQREMNSYVGTYDKTTDKYVGGNLPGVNETWTTTLGSGPTASTKDYASGINGAGFTTHTGAAFGSEEAWKTGYNFSDYETMAEYYGTTQANYGNLTDLGLLLTSMTPQDGRQYQSGADMQVNLWEEYGSQYVAAQQNAGLPVSGSMDDDFFKWLSGINPDFSTVTPLPGAQNIDDKGFYQQTYNYIKSTPVETSNQALNLLLLESNITKGAATKLMGRFNASNQVATSGGAAATTTGQSVTKSGSNISPSSNVPSAPAGTIYNITSVPPSGTPSFNFTAGTPVKMNFTGANGQPQEMEVTGIEDQIPLTGDKEEDVFAITANFENVKGLGASGGAANYGFTGANTKLKSAFDKELKNNGGDKYKAFKTVYESEVVPKAALQLGAIKYEDAKGNTIKPDDYDKLNKTDKAKYTAKGDVDWLNQEFPDPVMRQAVTDWTFNTGRNVQQLLMASKLLAGGKDAKDFKDKYGLDNVAIEKMINDGKPSSFEIEYKNDKWKPGDKKEKIAAGELWKKIMNDKLGTRYDMDAGDVTLEELTNAKHAIMGSDFASADATKQAAARKNYEENWQYRINMYNDYK